MSVYDVILHYNCATSGTICVKSQLSCDNTALFVLIALLVGEITAVVVKYVISHIIL